MHIFWHDFETKSRVDLRAHGSPLYAADKSTDALCMAYAIDNEPPELWLPGQPVPDAYLQAIAESWEFHAWNAAFERYITRFVMAIKHKWPVPPLDLYRCTMAKARYNNLPGKLEDCGERLKISKQFRKDAEGHKIMMRLSKPDKKGNFIHDPQLLGRLFSYCKQDVVAEQYIDSLLLPMPDCEQEIWRLDRVLNERGCPIDVPYCRAAYNMVESLSGDANIEIRKLTATPERPNGYVTSTGCVAKIKELVQARGVNIGTLDKESVKWALEGHNAALVDGKIQSVKIDPVAKRLLELRQLGAPAAVKKYRSAIDRTSLDGLMREALIYYGAGHTGRWTGDGTQLQNLFRKTADAATTEAIGAGDRELLELMYANPMGALQLGVRGMICAPEGHDLVISDSAAIEARIVLWVSGCRNGVKLFQKSDAKEGPEPYCVMGSKIYSVPVQQVVKGTQARAVGKEAVLGLGFGMGATKFQGSAKEKAGVDLSTAMCEKTVKMWRGLHPEVCKLWRDMEDAFKKATNGAKDVKVNSKLSFHNVRGMVAMRLPSGRHLFYHEPKALRRGISFLTVRGREETWGGHLVENAVQAMARDIIAFVMQRLEACFGFVALSIHDEIIQCVISSLAKRVAEVTHEYMRTAPEWASGLPLNAETGIAKRLTK